MSVDWFKWMRHEQDFADMPCITRDPLPTPEDHPDNWDELDFQADLAELNVLASQVIDASPRASDLADDFHVDGYFDWNRRRSILQFAADSVLTATFKWPDSPSFEQMWADA